MSNKLVETQTRTDRAIQRQLDCTEPVEESLQAAMDAFNAEITHLHTEGHTDLAAGLASIAVMYDDAIGDAKGLMAQHRDLLVTLGDKVRDLRQSVRLAEKDAANNYNSGFYAGMQSRDKEITALQKKIADWNKWYKDNFASAGD